MNKAFEKILERLEIERTIANNTFMNYEMNVDLGRVFGLERAIEIVKEVAEEYNGGWIPCSERFPEEAFGCLVTVIDCEPLTQTDFENILPYVVGYDGDSWNDSDGNVIPFEVIAWQPLPEPFKECD